MRLPETIAGLRTIEMRAFFRVLRSAVPDDEHTCVAPADIARHFGVSAEQAAKIHAALIKAGLITSAPPHSLTVDGRRLAVKRMIARIPHAKADQLVRDLIARAKAINADPNLTHYIDELWAFGSYITDASDLGDVDVGYKVEDRYDLVRSDELNICRVLASGRTYSWSGRRNFGMQQVLRILKAGKAHLHVQPHSDTERMGALTKIVFKAKRIARHSLSWLPNVDDLIAAQSAEESIAAERREETRKHRRRAAKTAREKITPA